MTAPIDQTVPLASTRDNEGTEDCSRTRPSPLGPDNDASAGQGSKRTSARRSRADGSYTRTKSYVGTSTHSSVRGRSAGRRSLEARRRRQRASAHSGSRGHEPTTTALNDRVPEGENRGGELLTTRQSVERPKKENQTKPRRRSRRSGRIRPTPEAYSSEEEEAYHTDRYRIAVQKSSKGVGNSRGMVGKNDNGSSGKASFRNSFRRSMRQNSRSDGGGGGGCGGGGLSVDVKAAEAEHEARLSKKKSSKSSSLSPTSTPKTEASLTPASTPGGARTPDGIRGRTDLRSPGAEKTPDASKAAPPASLNDDGTPIPDFITQTDKFGNATTPRSSEAVRAARAEHPSGPVPHIHVTPDGKIEDDLGENSEGNEGQIAERQEGGVIEVDPCDALLESLRMMCCCLLVDEAQGGASAKAAEQATQPTESSDDSSEMKRDDTQYSNRGTNAPMLMPEEAAAQVDDVNRVRLLPKHHPDDLGKKCLVLDLDETLVHSSFRAVPGADFVIPVQIEDVVHFVYVAKRPGVDEFLTEMAKHYEIVIYTASLNKYADPLLDLLDPGRVIRTRLFRESCVYYEGNYVKDLSLLDRELDRTIIIDNSPSSYIFHPENAIDCSSFIDDPADRELEQIGKFLVGIKDITDVRHTCNLWREWPDVDISHVSCDMNGHQQR